MKFISLFAGIGGFDLGLERAGMQCVGQVERNPCCQRVLAHHWPEVKRIGDIRNVNGTEFGAVDLVCGGFPCQPFSHAGKRKGKADDRYLWPEMLRVIQAYRPAWVLGENVAGIVSMALDTVLSDLEAQGYQCEAFIIPACAVDAKHERKRVWIVGHSESGENNRREPGVVAKEEGCRQGFNNATYSSGETMAHSQGIGSRSGFCETGQGKNGNQFTDSGSDVSGPHGSGGGERRRAEPVQPEQYPAQCSGKVVSYTVNDGRNRTEGNEPKPGSDESDNGIFERGYEPEPGVGGTLDGFSGWLDGLDLNISHKLYLTYAKETNQRPGEVLRTLRNSILSQGIQWPIGRQECFSSSQVLLAYLCKLEAQAIDKAGLQLEGTEALENCLRSLQCNNQPSGAPLESAIKRQRAREYSDPLQALSRLLAHDGQKAFVGYRRTYANSLPAWFDGWENGINRVANGVPGRVDRLRSLGNAVVPPVVAVIGRAIRRANIVCAERLPDIKEAQLTAYNTAMPGGVPPQICEAQTSA